MTDREGDLGPLWFVFEDNLFAGGIHVTFYAFEGGIIAIEDHGDGDIIQDIQQGDDGEIQNAISLFQDVRNEDCSAGDEILMVTEKFASVCSGDLVADML